MSTLLIRLAAPVQSWGADSKFERRLTRREPTKSGVIGLVAAAMGRARNAALDDLVELKFGVRIDQPGQLLRDFHTARAQGAKHPYITERFYLCDAVFLVGLEGETALLQKIEAALAAPFFPLYLGRRSCPPVGRLSLGIREMPLAGALSGEAWQAGEWYQKKFGAAALTLVLDSDLIGGARQRDLPVTFDYRHRQYAYRYYNSIPDAVAVSQTSVTTTHDAFEGVDG